MLRRWRRHPAAARCRRRRRRNDHEYEKLTLNRSRSRAVKPSRSAGRHGQVPSGVHLGIGLVDIQQRDGNDTSRGAAKAVVHVDRHFVLALGLIVVARTCPGLELTAARVDAERALIRLVQAVDESVVIGIGCHERGADVHVGQRVLFELTGRGRSLAEHRHLVLLGPRLHRFRPAADPLGVPGKHLNLVEGVPDQLADRYLSDRADTAPTRLEAAAPDDSETAVIVP